MNNKKVRKFYKGGVDVSSQESKPKGNLISNFRDDMRDPKKEQYTHIQVL